MNRKKGMILVSGYKVFPDELAEEDVMKFCRLNLGLQGAQVHRIGDELPETNVGEILRRVLRAMR